MLEAMGQALQTATPQICSSDQGRHFTSPQWVSLLQEAGMSISMDGKGRATDNIFVERVWRTVKYEEVYLHDYPSPREARLFYGLPSGDSSPIRPTAACAHGRRQSRPGA